MVEAVDLVDEQDVALFKVGQDRGEVAGPFDGRAARRVQVDAQLAGDDVGQRGLAQAGRPVEQDVVGRFVALAGRLEQDLQVLLDVLLADVLGQGRGRRLVSTAASPSVNVPAATWRSGS